VTDYEEFAAFDQFVPPSDAAWRHVCRKARRLFPLDAPLAIVRRKLPGNDAARWYGDASGHRITISPRLALGSAIDALLHELTHAWLCEHDRAETDHGDAFWIVFGKFYRAWMQEPAVLDQRSPP
jgi:hypothetical protein